MKKKNKLTIYTLLPLLMVGCADHGISSQSEDNSSYPVKLRAEIEQINVTRANDTGFTHGDRIGVYMVDFEGGVPGTIVSTGNHADNIMYEYNENSLSWEGSNSLFFKDSSTAADFYGYYPYISSIGDVESIPFLVERNQSSSASAEALSGYEASDLLWAKEVGVSPSSSLINLRFNHILAGIEVVLLEGEGFESGEWNELDKSVLIDGTSRTGNFNLSTGTVDVTGKHDGYAIISDPNGNSFRAVVIPQNVSAGMNLMHINIGPISYGFTKEEQMNYQKGKLHKFTFEVTKKQTTGEYEFSLLNESVTMWESDSKSHNGEGKAYVSVDIHEGQSLEEALAYANVSVSDVVNLKLTGFLAADDFMYIRDNMRKLQALNLKDVRIVRRDWIYEENAIPDIALTNLSTLKYIIFPDKLEKIGEYAFAGTILEGSLKIPEGVKYIGNSAFSNVGSENGGYSPLPGGQILANNNLTGTLELPSTLEYIGSDAFRSCDFTGNLILPHSLRHIGKNAFCNCRNFKGEIHFPDNLVEIEETSVWDLSQGEGAFYGMSGLVGNLELPKRLKIINGFSGLDVSNILFPEEPLEIGTYAFFKTNVKGNIVIPNSVTNIKEYAFYSCSTPHISLPENLTRISDSSFAYCNNLSDTIHIPQNVEVIDGNAFRECTKLPAITLPAKLIHIGAGAFENCFSMEYIFCAAKEPPTVDESAFNGIAKDNFTIEVPEESVDAYRNHPIWGEFKRISAYHNFVARPSKYNVLNRGGKKEIVLNANTEWEMTECPAWCHIDKVSGSKKTTITLTVDQLSHGQPSRNGVITFRLKNSESHFTHINVGQYDYEYDEDSCIDLQKATKGKGIDIFLLGDGYDAADISSGLLINDMKQTMEYFFAVEPFTTYRDYFNIKVGVALSEDSGFEELNRWKTTKFHTVVPKKCGENISADWKTALDYTAEICPSLLNQPIPRVGVILLSNYDGYGGVTYIGDSFCSLVTKSTRMYPFDARGLVQHEACGHGIGWLADEYIYHNDFIQRCGCSCCKHESDLLNLQQNGFGLNVSLNGKYNTVDWSHLISHPSYGDIVDVYEGGYFHRKGVFRSEYNSCMNNNVPYFSTWSRQLIVQRIMKLAGESFSLENFYLNDKRNVGKDFTSSTRGMSDSELVGPRSSAPIFIMDYTLGKKGGER